MRENNFVKYKLNVAITLSQSTLPELVELGISSGGCGIITAAAAVAAVVVVVVVVVTHVVQMQSEVVDCIA